ncbi:MAG: rRNA maturation RNase YbeY [Treponema sp.]|nr:rRNA maturation RNase YbeY [Treponema sp.]
MNNIEIGAEGVDIPSWRDRAVSFINRALVLLDLDDWELSVLFCGNSYIQSLNSRYRGQDEPTDVLSFRLDERHGDRYYPGDIVISLEALEENASRFKVSPDEELRRLLIHGILHLDGMDHASNAPEEPMLKKQEEILRELAPEHIMSEV